MKVIQELPREELEKLCNKLLEQEHYQCHRANNLEKTLSKIKNYVENNLISYYMASNNLHSGTMLMELRKIINEYYDERG